MVLGVSGSRSAGRNRSGGRSRSRSVGGGVANAKKRLKKGNLVTLVSYPGKPKNRLKTKNKSRSRSKRVRVKTRKASNTP